MPIFEDLFTQAKKEDVQEKILQELREIKQLMIPKVVYVPVYIEQKPWWHCEPLYPERLPTNDYVDCIKYSFPGKFAYTVDYAEHVCLAGACVST